MTRLALLSAACLCLGLPASASERESVEAVVRDAYIGGVHLHRDAAAMRRGFHPEFRMLALREGRLQAVTLDEWAGRIEKAAGESAGPRPQVRGEITQVDVVGTAAAVRVEIHRDGRLTFTDHLSLYRFPDGWKIVSKTFYSHPGN